MRGKNAVYADEEPKDKEKRIFISVLVTSFVLLKDTHLHPAVYIIMN
jgi:hypothetical protein